MTDVHLERQHSDTQYIARLLSDYKRTAMASAAGESGVAGAEEEGKRAARESWVRSAGATKGSKGRRAGQ